MAEALTNITITNADKAGAEKRLAARRTSADLTIQAEEPEPYLMIEGCVGEDGALMVRVEDSLTATIIVIRKPLPGGEPNLTNH